MKVKLLSPAEVTVELQEQLTTLYQELNAEINQIPLKRILESPDTIEIACCMDNNQLVGIAMMAKYTVISGHKGMIEDVVVSSHHRGKGIGRQLMELLLKRAKKCKLDDVLLFSGHHRKPAINLYKSLGFALKNSGLYVKKMK
ncbi:GNAT family N-acetyltransferase [Maribacter sp. 2210JD10-5]|uniref:GNAT family N-acetyltransferase n=1 Tax=Maribacter sp. 2210JD10-5 TaxID=3386272 RepID=UPI0039BC5748